MSIKNFFLVICLPRKEFREKGDCQSGVMLLPFIEIVNDCRH